MSERNWRRVTWIGVTIGALSLIAWCISLFGPIWISRPRFTTDPLQLRWYVSLGGGTFQLGNRLSGHNAGLMIISRRPEFGQLHWWFPKGPGWMAKIPLGESTWYLGINLPLWMPAALGIGLATWGGLPSNRIRRRRTRGLCVKCAYDRRGLAAEAPCPECGVA